MSQNTVSKDSDVTQGVDDDCNLVCTPDINFHPSEADTPSGRQFRNRRTSSRSIDMCPQMMGFGMATNSKRKHKVLSLADKIELIKKSEAGETSASLATFYNVGRATIVDIKNKKESILAFASKLEDHELKTKKTLGKPKKGSKFKLSKGGIGGSLTTQSSENLVDCDVIAKKSYSSSKLNDDKIKAINNDLQLIYGNLKSHSSTSQPDGKDIQPQSLEQDNEYSPKGKSVKPKRKHHVLSIDTKIEILQRLDRGETGVSLAPQYNVGKATITGIKAQRDSILMFASKHKSGDGLKKRKTMRKAKDTSLEDAVYMWYVQALNQGESVSGPKICDKALELNCKLGGPPNFKASTGWLKNFRSRHGINQLHGDGDIVMSETSNASSYLFSFLNLLGQEGYSRDDIYFVDEAIIDWQTMPRNSEVFGCRPTESNDNDQPVTVLLCSNASWDHTLPLLVIGKPREKRYFKNICLPVVYKSQRNGWMDTEVFMDWFANEFIPAVKERRECSGRYDPVLLLLDNASFHPLVEMLNRVDESFKGMLLPLNLPTSYNPMYHSAIKKLKKLFKLDILRRLMLAQTKEESVLECVEKLTLKECCHMLADAWKNISEDNKKEAGKTSWVIPEDFVTPFLAEDENLVKEVNELFSKISGFSNCTISDAKEWLAVDSADPGKKILNEDEIVASVKEDTLTSEEEEVYVEENLALEWQEEEKVTCPEDAFYAFETAMEWCEQQTDCSPVDLLFLKRLRDLAAKKSWVSEGSTKT